MVLKVNHLHLLTRWINKVTNRSQTTPTALVLRVSHQTSRPWALAGYPVSAKRLHVNCESPTLGQIEVSAMLKEQLEVRNLFLPEPAKPIQAPQITYLEHQWKCVDFAGNMSITIAIGVACKEYKTWTYVHS